MKVQAIKFELSKETIKHLEKSTKCSIEELRTISNAELKNVMIKRGAMKEPSKIKQWFCDKYKELGEKTGLLKKQLNIYTDID